MTERAWRFGDVVRVDPVANPTVPQPDNRRWMVVAPGRTDRAQPWRVMFIGRGVAAGNVGPWNTMHGFMLVEDDEEDDEHRPYIGEFD